MEFEAQRISGGKEQKHTNRLGLFAAVGLYLVLAAYFVYVAPVGT